MYVAHRTRQPRARYASCTCQRSCAIVRAGVVELIAIDAVDVDQLHLRVRKGTSGEDATVAKSSGRVSDANMIERHIIHEECMAKEWNGEDCCVVAGLVHLYETVADSENRAVARTGWEGVEILVGNTLATTGVQVPEHLHPSIIRCVQVNNGRVRDRFAVYEFQ